VGGGGRRGGMAMTGGGAGWPWRAAGRLGRDGRLGRRGRDGRRRRAGKHPQAPIDRPQLSSLVSSPGSPPLAHRLPLARFVKSGAGCGEGPPSPCPSPYHPGWDPSTPGRPQQPDASKHGELDDPDVSILMPQPMRPPQHVPILGTCGPRPPKAKPSPLPLMCCLSLESGLLCTTDPDGKPVPLCIEARWPRAKHSKTNT
jgi:hypothetical protein